MLTYRLCISRMRAFLITLVLCSVHAQEWELMWSDEFDGEVIDPENWEHEVTCRGQGSEQFHIYTPDPVNSYIKDGTVIIKPTLLENNTNPLTGEPFGQDFLYNGILDLEEMYGYCTDKEKWGEDACLRYGWGEGEWLNIPPIASARIRSKNKFSYRYGKAEIRSKAPVGDWMWASMWMLPNNECYGNWPRSGEIDISEIRCNEDFWHRDGLPIGLQRMNSALRWGMRYDDQKGPLTSNMSFNDTHDYGNNFHIYTFEWSPNGTRFLIDETLTLEVPSPQIPENPEWKGFFEYGKPWDSIDEDDPSQNPWLICHDPLLVPFDTVFYFMLDVAIGGTNGFFPDEPYATNRGGDPKYKKPWLNHVSQQEGMTGFYNGRDGWLWNWQEQEANNENNAMHVDYVRVYKRSDLPDAPAGCPKP